MARYEKYETKKGIRWMYIIENGIIPGTGKRKRIVKRGFLKEKNAKDAALDIEFQLSKGTLVSPQDILFREFSDRWLYAYSESVERPIKKKTLRTRNFTLIVLNDYFKLVKLTDIDHQMYQEFLFALKKSGYSANTMKIINSTATMIFNKARKDLIIIQNPTEFTFIPKEVLTVEEIENQTIEEKYFEKDELLIFLDAAKKLSDEDFTIFLLLSWTGLRIGELCALKWSDVNFEERILRVTKTYFTESERIDDFEITPPKTKSSIREIELEKEVIEELIVHQERQENAKKVLQVNYKDEKFIFARTNRSHFGYPVTPQSIRYRMGMLLKQIGIKKLLTPHSLRHTHTSLLAEAGVGLPEIMARLGHKNDTTTTNVYLHVTKERRREASSKFGDLMRNKNANQNLEN